MADDYLVKDAAGAPFTKAAKDMGGGRKADLSIIPGTAFADVSVASLSSGQAAGTSSVIASNVNRKIIAITPANDGRLYIASAAGNGFFWPLYAGVTRTLSGADCPTNALFVTGQTVDTALPMAEG
jgi:hypothetical protein